MTKLEYVLDFYLLHQLKIINNNIIVYLMLPTVINTTPVYLYSRSYS